MVNLAVAVADLAADIGMAFIDDDRVGALGKSLRDFLAREHIAVDTDRGATYFRSAEEYVQRFACEPRQAASIPSWLEVR